MNASIAEVTFHINKQTTFFNKQSITKTFLMSSAKLPKITCDFRNLEIFISEMKTIEQNEGFCREP